MELTLQNQTLHNQGTALGQIRARRDVQRAADTLQLDARQSILQAAEQLLSVRALADVTTSDMIAESGLSRGTFYSYFASKGAVVSALLEDVMGQMFESLAPFIEDDALTRSQRVEKVLNECIELWREHKGVLRATHESWQSAPELGANWLSLVEKFTEAIAARVEEDIDLATTSHQEVRQRAACVLWATEHLLYVAGSSVGDDLPSEGAIVKTLERLWLGTLYGNE